MYSVEEKLPQPTHFVWVKRASQKELELAYFTGRDNKSSQFQDPYTVGDREGLYVEYFTDVIYWAELVPPVVHDKCN